MREDRHNFMTVLDSVVTFVSSALWTGKGPNFPSISTFLRIQANRLDDNLGTEV